MGVWIFLRGIPVPTAHSPQIGVVVGPNSGGLALLLSFLEAGSASREDQHESGHVCIA